jgi:hypothetical protein
MMPILTGSQTHTLPPRKAAPLAQSPSAEDVGNRPRSPSKSAELHSPLSPLSPGSPIFPDGIFTPLWLAKHQHQIPAAFIAFFDIRAGDGAAADDQIKADINSVRSALSRSGFKTRFAAVLLSDKSILHAAELEDRLASIRRSTNLDSKTGLYFMPPVSSQAEMGAFVQGVLTTLQPSVVEYYRDLTKHARRKKARGSIPTTVSVPSSQSLSNIGWNARYEAKQGIFAEFRQEMDVAERHYSQAIEDLFNPEGVFETTPSWHPRWTEARLLSDVLAMRVIRCQLWNSSTTGASQSWSNYRLRMKDLVDRRGKGSQTYGWEAWESRWAKIMAELTRRADLPALRTQAKQPLEGSNKVEPTSLLPYALPEKAFSAIERLPPFDLLHHAGYWLRMALNSTRARWQRSLAIPDEDRSSPDGSPASALAKRARAYDTYLVPPPHKEYPSSGEGGFDHLAAIQQLSDLSCREFTGKGQMRLGEKIRLNTGNDLIEAGRFEEALEQLTPLWEECTWRNDGWYSLYEELLSQLHKCAVKAQKDPRLVLATTWELLGAEYTAEESEALDIRHCIDGLGSEAVSVLCKDRQRLSPVSLGFAFANKQAFAGEPLNCQLQLTSNVRHGTLALALTSVKLAIDGTRPVVIMHDEGASACRATNLSLNTTDDKLSGDVNLTLQPQETRVFNFALTFREAQAVKLQEATISLVTEKFSIHHSFQDEMLLQTAVWLSELDDQLVPSSLYRDETTVVDVLPKPPKIQVLLHGLHQQYYIGEQVNLQLEIVNGEADAVRGTIGQVVVAQDDIVLHSQFGTHEASSGDDQDPTSEAAARQDFSGLQPSEVKKIGLSIDAPMEPLLHTLTIDVDYTLASEPDTPLKRSVNVELLYVAPFEAKFNFGPLVHTDPWPSYFDPALLSPSGEPPSGILRRWRLGSQVTSLASDSIIVQSAEIVIDQVNDDADFRVLESSEDKVLTVAPNAKFERSFQASTQKLSLDDRRPTILELSLAITWKRTADSTLCTTRVPFPRLNIPSSEPRVLCVASQSDDDPTDVVLKYYLENSSSHHLTFAVTLEANDDFAFQGPKHNTFSLVPFSRHELTYSLLVNSGSEEGEQGRWIWPVLQVVDVYFQQTLRVLAAGPGVRIDPQRGIGVWVPAVKA